VLSAMLCALFIIRAEVDLLDVISHFLYIHNLSDEYLYSFSPPFWYLSVQMQAYVLLPLLGWFCSVEQFGGSVRRVFLLALAFAISLGFVITLTKLGSQDGAFSRWVLLNPMSVTHSIFVHLPNFLVGMAIQSALMHEKSPSIRRGLSIDLVIVFVIGVLVFISLISEGSSYSSSYVRYGFPAIVFPLAFGLVLIPRSLLVKRFFDHPILQWIGKISFAFYLVHYSCIKVCILILHRIDLGMIGIPEHVVMLPFCFLLSILSAYILNRVVHLTWFCRKISG
jgi:peptidoglycan/LPS O-acetylase OafA/YrhL